MKEDLKYTLMVIGMVVSWSIYYALCAHSAPVFSVAGPSTRAADIQCLSQLSLISKFSLCNNGAGDS